MYNVQLARCEVYDYTPSRKYMLITPYALKGVFTFVYDWALANMTQ